VFKVQKQGLKGFSLTPSRKAGKLLTTSQGSPVGVGHAQWLVFPVLISLPPALEISPRNSLPTFGTSGSAFPRASPYLPKKYSPHFDFLPGFNFFPHILI